MTLSSVAERVSREILLTFKLDEPIVFNDLRDYTLVATWGDFNDAELKSILDMVTNRLARNGMEVAHE